MSRDLSIYMKPIDYEVAHQIFDEDLIEFLHVLKVERVLDVNEFVAGESRYPAIGSVFVVGDGQSGSWDDSIKVKIRNGEYSIDVSVYNGTISCIGCEDFEDVGAAYYEAKYCCFFQHDVGKQLKNCIVETDNTNESRFTMTSTPITLGKSHTSVFEQAVERNNIRELHALINSKRNVPQFAFELVLRKRMFGIAIAIINKRCELPPNAFELAVNHGNDDVIKKLLSSNCTIPDNAIELIISKDKHDILRTIIALGKATQPNDIVNIAAKYGAFRVLQAVRSADVDITVGAIEIAFAHKRIGFIERCISPGFGESRRRDVFELACRYKCKKIVMLFIENVRNLPGGMNIVLANGQYYAVRHLFMRFGHAFTQDEMRNVIIHCNPRTVRTIAEAQPNCFTPDDFMTAIAHDNVDVVRELLKHGFQFNALHFQRAVTCNSLKVMRFAFDMADDQIRRDAIETAITRGSIAMIALLLNRMSCSCVRYIDLAIARNSWRIMKLLIDNDKSLCKRFMKEKIAELKVISPKNSAEQQQS